jgi:glycerol-3-phosphate dehydrogenase
MKAPVSPGSVVASYAGVRPLYDDEAAAPSAITRDYVFDIESGPGRPPLLSIFGGKITTYRRLAEHALQKLAPFLPRLAPGWTGSAPLPGGDLPDGDFDGFVRRLRTGRPWLPPRLARRLARAYGTRVEHILADARALADLGADLGAGLTEREAAYLVETEWARTPEDILVRRSRLALHGGAELQARVEQWLAKRESMREPHGAVTGVS